MTYFISSAAQRGYAMTKTMRTLAQNPVADALDPELIQLVRDWIADGAQDN